MNLVDGRAFLLGSEETARGMLVFVLVGVHASNTWVPALKKQYILSPWKGIYQRVD